MPLYHACQRTHPDGYVLAVPAGEQAHAYTKSVSGGRSWLENALEQARAGRGTARRVAVYACDRPELAARFALSELGDMPIVYEVRMTDALAAPMGIIDHAARKGPGWAELPRATGEYWATSQPWAFLEYLAPAATIVRAVHVDEMAVYGALEDFEQDRAICRALWGR